MQKYTTVFLILFSISAYCQTQITFSLDTRNIPVIEKTKLLNLGLRGNVKPLSWVRGKKLTDNNNDGIYETSVLFENQKQDTLYFKYVLNEIEWENGDALKVNLNDNKSFSSSFRYENPKENPFKKFIGEWTLKNNQWLQGETTNVIDTLYLPNHYTKCEELNTRKSLLWSVNSTSAQGHALWTYNSTTKKVFMQSSFYSDRIGLGSGTINANSDINLDMVFEGSEPNGTYRKYTYKWINDNEYILTSHRYNKNNIPTGHFYGGTFIRIKTKN